MNQSAPSISKWNRAWTFVNPLRTIHLRGWIHLLISIVIMLVLFTILMIGSFNWLDLDFFYNAPDENTRIFRIKQAAFLVIQIFLSGLVLGVGAYLIQTLTKNRFADSSIIGIGNINLLSMVLLLVVIGFNDVNAQTLYDLTSIQPIIFFLTPLILLVIYYYFCRENERFNFKKMILTGIIINFIVLAIVPVIANIYLQKLGFVFLNRLASGSLTPLMSTINDHHGELNHSFTPLYIAFAMVVCGFFVLALISNKIRIIAANQQVANQLGINVKLYSVLTFAIVALMVGASYAMNGNLIFIGLVASNIAIRIQRSNFKKGIAMSGAMGASIYLSAVLILYFGLSFKQEWVNLSTPILIAPYFIILISKKEKV
ncbi:iron ABC transporter permease [Ureaplasma sp. ES3154-GEN]|uniref:iron ABC transporter permease n=1 Tax=Ureaplasma sp. ES3154-GEN TaxID=2984844 RepID=UPI0021E99201|nr:iron ABC transporter permease [Ureaplasma sp. ES3154-GEN]MCV3743634.1 iron ABC transporter permease [Ureaplasma sp. ES3154-GEN]